MAWLVDFLTEGKARELQVKAAERARVRDELIRAGDSLREARQSMSPSMRGLGHAKEMAIRSLKRVVWILGDSPSGDFHASVPGVNSSGQHPSFSETIHEFEAAVGAVKGLGAGGAGAVGAWALVSTFGTASTGAAIGALHGVAATNAALV